MKYSMFVALSLALAASARPGVVGRASFTLQNGQEAIALNQQFATLTANSPCTVGQDACVNQQFAQCVNGKFVTQACAPGTICAALPLVNSPGTSVTCTTTADLNARIAATGATTGSAASGASGAASSSVASVASSAASSSVASAAASSSVAAASTASSSAAAASGTAATGDNSASGSAASGDDSGDPQSSPTLLQSVIATGFENDGQAQPTAGQVASLTSSNNFINFCATVPNIPITNGLQITGGSCNPAPMGIIASTANMPSSKFVFPTNGGSVTANQNFTIQMAIKNLETGNFVNADENYFAAPQQINAQGNIQGHSHVVVETLSALDQTTPTNPAKFAFFKGLNAKDQGGILSVVVPGGLPAGVYRLASINTAANHQPALVAVAQHGSLDDMVYFTSA